MMVKKFKLKFSFSHGSKLFNILLDNNYGSLDHSASDHSNEDGGFREENNSILSNTLTSSSSEEASNNSRYSSPHKFPESDDEEFDENGNDTFHIYIHTLFSSSYRSLIFIFFQ